MGIPHRVVISEKTIAENKIEHKKRTASDTKLLSEQELLKTLASSK
jgi:prolyl-tRNA synthetase